MPGLTFYNKDFSRSAQMWQPIQVTWLEWAALGGPSAGQLSAAGYDLVDMVALLRCPVEIWLDDGTVIWWGFVNSIIGDGWQVTLDDLANSVAVSYYYNGSDVTKLGVKTLTAWASDVESKAVFGTKEKILAINKASDSLAIYKRDVYLNDHKRAPVYPVNLAARGDSGVFVLGLKGWWSTLGWDYYSTAMGKIGYTDISGDVQSIGNAAATSAAGQRFSVTVGGWPSTYLEVSARCVGAPADNFVLEFRYDNGGVPGAVIGSATVAGSSFPTGFQWLLVTLSASISMAAATQYWVKISRSGAADAVNYYQVRVNEAMGFNTQDLRVFDNVGAITLRSPAANLNFMLSGLTETSAQVAAIAAAGASGQFLAGCRVDAGSGVYSNAWRDGFRTGLAEVNELLTGGNSAGLRLLAMVDRRRWLQVKAAPVVAELALQADGRITTPSGAQVTGDFMVGKWARITGRDVLPAGGAVTMARNVWIEGVRWEGGVIRIIP